MIYRLLPNQSLFFWDLVKYSFLEIKKTEAAVILILTLCTTLIGVLIPYLNQVIYDDTIPFGNLAELLQLGILVIAFSVGNLSFSIVKNIFIFRVSTKIEHSLQSAVFDRLFHLPGDLYERYDSAVLSKSAFAITEICAFLSEAVITTILAAVFSVVYLYRMALYSPALTVRGCVMILFEMSLIFGIGLVQLKQNKKITEIQLKESSLIYQFIDGIQKIRIAGVENRAVAKYFELYTKHKKKCYEKDKLSNLLENINIVFNVAFTATFYWMLIKSNVALSFGHFMAFIAAFGAFSAALIQLMTTFCKSSHLLPLYEKCSLVLKSTQEY